MSILKIYGSSAGSGKTFTLTKEYLKLLLEPTDNGYEKSNQYFKNILAITFTNDAAAEMKKRVMDALIAFSTPPITKKFLPLQEVILSEIPAINEEFLQKKSRFILEQMLRDYSDINIQTIDSFVNRLVNTFSRDLDIPYNYEIILDRKDILEQAIGRLLEKIGMKGFEYLTDLIQNFAEEVDEDGRSWQNIPQNLYQHVNEDFNDEYYHIYKKNEDLKLRDYQEIKKNIFKFQQITKMKFEKLSDKSKELMVLRDLHFSDFSQKMNGFGGFLQKLADQNYELLLEDKFPNSYVIKAVEQDVWYAKDAAESSIAKIEAAKNELIDLYHEFSTFLEKYKLKYLILSEILKSLNSFSLISEIKKEIDQILIENNQTFITDFNRKISDIVMKEPIPYIYERLGEKFNHILIDEFQDTSDMQFFNLLPLIENSLSKGHLSLMVGDPKQSIYRFRGGKVELMIQLLQGSKDLLKANPYLADDQGFRIDYIDKLIKTQTLKSNFRSEPEIIQFNNDFFEFLLQKQNSPLLNQAFQDHQQLSPKTEAGTGHISFILGELKGNTADEEKIDEKEWYLDQLERQINDLIANNYNLDDIAILCRTNVHTQLIASHFQRLGYPISSSDSLVIGNNLAVAVLTNCLQSITEGKYLNETQLLICRLLEKPFPDSKEEFENVWQMFETLGLGIEQKTAESLNLYQLTEYLCAKIGIFEHYEHHPFVFAFLDIIQEFIKKDGDNLYQFLKTWNRNKTKATIKSKPTKALTITTIHKSKGLEYTVVLLPFADYALNRSKKAWFDIEALGYEELMGIGGTLKAANLSLHNRLSNSKLEAQYHEYREIELLECLNNLYVACTRAVQRLVIISTKPSNSNISKYYKEYLLAKNILPQNEHYYVVSEGKYSPNEEKTIEQETVILDKIVSHLKPSKMRIQSPLQEIYEGDNQRQKGNQIHLLFSKIKKAGDLEEALRRMYFEGLAYHDEIDELRTEALKVLQHPELHPLFHGDIQVNNEREIIIPKEESKRPDRVIITPQNTYIIDYKTGMKKPKDEQQLKKYGEYYTQMGYQNIELMLVYLSPLEVVKLIR